MPTKTGQIVITLFDKGSPEIVITGRVDARQKSRLNIPLQKAYNRHVADRRKESEAKRAEKLRAEELEREAERRRIDEEARLALELEPRDSDPQPDPSAASLLPDTLRQNALEEPDSLIIEEGEDTPDTELETTTTTEETENEETK